MKTIIFGDTHGRNFWKLVLNTEEWDKAVFIGDYFDSWDFSCLEQMANFQELIAFKEQSKKPVILLIGNHDFHYFPEIGNQKYSGYQGDVKAISIGSLLNEYRDHLVMAYSIDNVLFTHAGVGEAWMERIVRHNLVPELPTYNAANIATWVNDIWMYKPKLFSFIGRDDTGDDMGQTPIWIRPRSLMKDSQVLKSKGIIQVVGHTGQKCIDIKGKATGGKYYFIDTLGTSGEYLIIEDDAFSVSKV